MPQVAITLLAGALALALGGIAARTLARALSARPRAVGALVQGALLAGVAVFIAMQAVPFGRDHENPSRRVEPQWDSGATRELAVRACFDCHSNETVWPWYSHVAPVSWLVARDVEEGRAELNFSEFDRAQEEAGEAAESVLDGDMPLRPYLLTHPEARLTAEEQRALADGLAATLGTRSRERAGRD